MYKSLNIFYQIYFLRNFFKRHYLTNSFVDLVLHTHWVSHTMLHTQLSNKNLCIIFFTYKCNIITNLTRRQDDLFPLDVLENTSILLLKGSLFVSKCFRNFVLFHQLLQHSFHVLDTFIPFLCTTNKYIYQFLGEYFLLQ